MPNMPTISDSPRMPSISTPTFGGKFYHPGTTNVRNVTNSNQEKVTQTQDDSKNQNTNDSIQQNLISNLTNIPNYLTADDISTLYNNGSFSNIYSLLQNQNEFNQNSNNSTDLLLTKILNELETLKNQQNNANNQNNSVNQQEQISNQNQTSFLQNSNRPAILRFIINGYDVLNTCKTIYFSQIENDGTFLLTADRKYLSDNESRTETFYILFKADGNSGTSKGYNINVSVIQDKQNEYSLLYKLSQEKNLKAEKTGNLVSLRKNDQTLNLDLLLDIGN